MFTKTWKVFFTRLVEKTFAIFGSKRGKTPLASLIVLEGPTELVGQELQIFSRTVRLGRDPRQTDLTLYTDRNSSVRRLHARIEHTGDAWQIVTVPESGAETFVNGQAIPVDVPQRLSFGDRIQLGYTGQDPVVLQWEARGEGIIHASHSAAYEASDESEMDAALPGDPTTDAPPPEK